MRQPLVIAVILTALIAAAGLWLAQQTAPANNDMGATTNATDDASPRESALALNKIPDASAALPADCASLDELRVHPDLLAAEASFEAISWHHLEYRPLLDATEAQLHGLAEAGDDAALAVLATRSLLLATDNDPDFAVPIILHGGKPDNCPIEDLSLELRHATAHGSFTKSQLAHLEAAAQHYYRLVQRGRIIGLSTYADLVDKINAGSVGLGWLTPNEFETMSARQRRLFDAEIVYADVSGRLLYDGDTMFDVSILPKSLAKRREDLLVELSAVLRADLAPGVKIDPEEIVRIQTRAETIIKTACPGSYEKLLDERERALQRWH